MQIIIQTLPHSQQRYETVGDWYEDTDKNIVIKVSETGNEDYNFLVGIHEAIECWLCKKHNITDAEVTDFDKTFELKRAFVQVEQFAEPGNDPSAPYYFEHQFSTEIERQIAIALGVDWNKYDEAINSL